MKHGHGPLAEHAVRFAGCKGDCWQARREYDMPLGTCFVVEPAPAEAATEVGESPRVPRKLPDGAGIVIGVLGGLVFFGVIGAALVAAFK